ncbi:hypothetical protein [Xylocopilactobacillus apis]|nr:hypothetical protein [Xylocopilactobacillus apis]
MIQKNTVDETQSSKLITNFYLADSIRRLAPENAEKFTTNQGILLKQNGVTIVKLNNGYKRVFNH